MESCKYWAFISYSHLDNRRERSSRSSARLTLWGNWLHETLETYKVPREIAGHTNKFGETVPDRIIPVFQDEKELQTGPHLADTIQEALNLSRFLIVICSPRSSQSLYCNEEVRYWKELGRRDRILPIIIDGEPNASDGTKAGVDPGLECFMPALRHPLDETNAVDVTRRDVEPICADVRSPEHGGELSAAEWRRARPIIERARLKLLSGLLGVPFDDLVKRDQARRWRTRRRIISWAAVAIALTSSVFGVREWQRREAEAGQLSANLELEAQSLVESGQPAKALAFFAAAARVDPRNITAQQRLYSLISSRNWAVPRKISDSPHPVNVPPPEKLTVEDSTCPDVYPGGNRISGHPLPSPPDQGPLAWQYQYGRAGDRLLIGAETADGKYTYQIWQVGRADPIVTHLDLPEFPYQIYGYFDKSGNRVYFLENRPTEKPSATALVTEPAPKAVPESDEFILDAKSGALLEKHEMPGAFLELAFAPDRLHACLRLEKDVLFSRQGLAGPWDRLQNIPATIRCPRAAFSEDSRVIALVADDTGDDIEDSDAYYRRSSLHLLSCDTEQEINHPVYLREMPWGLVFSHDSGIVAVRSEHAIWLFDVPTGALIGSEIELKQPWDMDFSPDDALLLTKTEHELLLLNARDCHRACEPPGAPIDPNSVSFGSDSQTLVGSSSANDLQQPAQVEFGLSSGGGARFQIKQRNGVKAFALRPGGEQLATAGGDNSLRFWSVTTGEQLGGPIQLDSATDYLEYSADGKRLLALEIGDEQHQAKDSHGQSVVQPIPPEIAVWDVATRMRVGAGVKVVPKSSSVHSMSLRSEFRGISLSADGARLFVRSEKDEMGVWDVASGNKVQDVPPGDGDFLTAQFSPGGGGFLVATTREISFYSPAHTPAPGDPAYTRSVVLKIAPKRVDIEAVKLSHDGKLIAADCADNKVRLIDVAHPEIVREIAAGKFTITKLSPDNALLATTEGEELFLRPTNTAQTSLEPIETGGSISGLAFDSSGRRIATVDVEGVTQIWDCNSGRRIGFPLQNSGESELAFATRDILLTGTLLAGTSFNDETVKLWELFPQLAASNASEGAEIAEVLGGYQVGKEDILKQAVDRMQRLQKIRERLRSGAETPWTNVARHLFVDTVDARQARLDELRQLDEGIRRSATHDFHPTPENIGKLAKQVQDFGDIIGLPAYSYRSIGRFSSSGDPGSFDSSLESRASYVRLTPAGQAEADAIEQNRFRRVWKIDPELKPVLRSVSRAIEGLPFDGWPPSDAQRFADERARLLIADRMPLILAVRTVPIPEMHYAVPLVDGPQGKEHKNGDDARTFGPGVLRVDDSGIHLSFEHRDDVTFIDDLTNKALDEQVHGRYLRRIELGSREMADTLYDSLVPNGFTDQITEAKKGQLEFLGLEFTQSRYAFVYPSDASTQWLDGEFPPITHARIRMANPILRQTNNLMIGGFLIDIQTGSILSFGGGLETPATIPIEPDLK